MDVKKLIAVCGAIVVAVVSPAAAAVAAAGTTVTVRIEGVKKTLLAPSRARTHAGWITKGGTPSGTCPETSAAGALDVATHHRWGGTYSASVGGLEITSILGERHTFSSAYFWEIFVNNRAGVGGCAQTLHRGDQLLFAAEPVKGATEYPTAIRAPRHATVSRPFTVKVVWWGAKGIARPLKGADVTVRGQTMTTTSGGTVQVTSATPGRLVIRADEKHYIRAAPVRVQVSG
jgi:hypothetical protein